MTCAAVIAIGIISAVPPPPDDDDDDRKRPPRPTPPAPRPSGADLVRDMVKDVKDSVPDTEDTLQP